MRHITCLLLAVFLVAGGCEILGPSEPKVSDSDLSLSTDSLSYVVRRGGARAIGITLEATITNRSDAKVFFSGCGRFAFRIEQEVDGEWEPREGRMRACVPPHESSFVGPREDLTITLRESTYDQNLPGEHWGEKNVSGTYRIKLFSFRHFEYKTQEYDSPVPESGLISNTFELSDPLYQWFWRIN